jgi:hypothetical protein
VADVFAYEHTNEKEFVLGTEESKEEAVKLEDQNKKIKDFYKMIYGLGTIDTNPTQQDEFRDA